MTTLIRVSIVSCLLSVGEAPAWAGPLSRPPLVPTVAEGADARGGVRPEFMLARLAQPEQQDEFIPIDELPPQEQLAAAPLLIGAYAFVLAVFFLYVLSVSRRLVALGRDIERLESEVRKGGRG